MKRLNTKQLLRSERGSLTLVTEALLLVIFGVIAFAAVKALLSRAEEKSAQTQQLIQCSNVLDCPAIENKNK